MTAVRFFITLIPVVGVISAVVLPRPPGTRTAATTPMSSSLSLVTLTSTNDNPSTSSELPKQIPAPSQPPPQHSSTLEYREQIPASPRLAFRQAHWKPTIPQNGGYIKRSDLLPNMIDVYI